MCRQTTIPSPAPAPRGFWQRPGRLRLIPASIILGAWLAQAALFGMTTRPLHHFNLIDSAVATIQLFPITATIGATIGAMISPLIALCLWRKPFGPALLAAYIPATIAAIISGHHSLIPVSSDFSIRITALTLAVSAIITMLAMPSRKPAGHCPSCNYDLTGLLSPQCPECGKPLDTHPTTPSSGTDL